MKIGQVFGSIPTWKKLCGMNMQPRLAYKIHKYVQKVAAEHDIAEDQRVSIIREITNTPEGDVRIEPNTPEFEEYVRKYAEVANTEIELGSIDITMDQLLDAVSEKNGALTPADLTILEPFFES